MQNTQLRVSVCLHPSVCVWCRRSVNLSAIYGVWVGDALGRPGGGDNWAGWNTQQGMVEATTKDAERLVNFVKKVRCWRRCEQIGGLE